MKTSALDSFLGLAYCCVVFGFTGVACASNPWSSEVGEAKDVQRTAAEITRRLNEEHPFSPAADVARLLEQQSSQLLRIVRDGADWNRIVVSLNNTKAVFCNLRAVANQDCHARDDRSLQRSLEAFDRRFNRLEAALVRRYEKLTPPICPPVHPPVCPPVVRRPPIHVPPIHEPPVRILPIPRQPAPLPPFRHAPPSYYQPEEIPAVTPNYRVEFSREQGFPMENPYSHDHRLDRSAPSGRSAGRQIMSVVINELVNRL